MCLVYLIQGGLGDGVILNPQQLLVLGEDGEDVGEGGERRWKLVLQHVPVLLLQRAAAQLTLNELHDGLKVTVRPPHPQDDGVPITKPGIENHHCIT